LTADAGEAANRFFCGFPWRRLPGRAFFWSQQFSRRQPGGRPPEPFQSIELARLLAENVDHEVHIIQQHPFRLAVSLGVLRTQAGDAQPLLHFIGNRLDFKRLTHALETGDWVVRASAATSLGTLGAGEC